MYEPQEVKPGRIRGTYLRKFELVVWSDNGSFPADSKTAPGQLPSPDQQTDDAQEPAADELAVMTVWRISPSRPVLRDANEAATPSETDFSSVGSPAVLILSSAIVLPSRGVAFENDE